MGVLGGTPDNPLRPKAAPRVEAVSGLRVMHRGTRTIGTIQEVVGDGVVVQTVAGIDRIFRMLPEGFIVDGKVVTLVEPRRTPAEAPTRKTASGSIASPQPSRAKVAKASRLWVEGIHDAELVEKVWGDDLREAGVVVERLNGIDDLVQSVRAFAPGPTRRLGILVDHLVPNSKESALAAQVASEYVLVTGTPYVDVWQAVRPSCIGIDRWPSVPKGEDWKTGVIRRLGWQQPAGAVWKRILASVKSYADLEPTVVGAVEQLLDHVLIDSI